jgi:hypothetical protein
MCFNLFSLPVATHGYCASIYIGASHLSGHAFSCWIQIFARSSTVSDSRPCYLCVPTAIDLKIPRPGPVSNVLRVLVVVHRA